MHGASEFISLVGLNLHGLVADAADWPHRDGGIGEVWHVACDRRQRSSGDQVDVPIVRQRTDKLPPGN